MLVEAHYLHRNRNLQLNCTHNLRYCPGSQMENLELSTSNIPAVFFCLFRVLAVLWNVGNSAHSKV